MSNSKSETDLTGELIALIKSRCPQLLALRHSDRFTSGIPDLSVSNRFGRTIWIELKRHEAATRSILESRYWIKKEDKLQLDTVVRLGGMYLVLDLLTSRYLYVTAARVYHDINRFEVLNGNHLMAPEFIRYGVDRRHAYDLVITDLAHRLYHPEELP